MKGYAGFVLIALMSLGLVFMLVTQSRAPYDAPALDPGSAVEAADAGDAATVEGGLAASDAAGGPAPRADKVATVAERPLRVTSLGWELVAAGVALTAPDGGATGPTMELSPEVTLEAVEARLARTGSDLLGADVAVLPLPAFVLAYDRLRALDPRVFAVVGFSRGREELHASPGALQKPLSAADEVKLVALGPATAADATARAAGSESATMLGLFALDLVGISPTRVRLLGPAAPDARTAPFAALVRGAADERRLAVSTADASRLVPIVLVASGDQLAKNEAKMRDFTRAWLDGLERVGRDAATVAQRLAAKEALPLSAGVLGAPDAIVLIDRLGQIAALGLGQQRSVMGSAAKGPVTLEALAQRQWTLARAGGLTTSAAPLPLPIDERIINAIAPAPAPAHDAPPRDADGADGGVAVTFPALPPGTTPLLTYRADTSSDVAAVAAQIGFLSGVFERSAFRVMAKGGEKAARIIATATRDRFDLSPARLATLPGEPKGAFAVVEVLALP